MEKRSQLRFTDPGSVICNHFNVKETCDGLILNFSQNGMCIRTPQYYKPGTAVQIRLRQCPRNKAVRQEDGGIRTVTLAKVQWSRDNKDLPGPRYTSGLQYF